MSSDSPKIVVVGASGAGKTAILHRLRDSTSTTKNPPTVGVEFLTYDCEVDGQQMKLQIWDTAGQERFKSVTKSYLRDAFGILLVFDLTNRSSFEAANDWLRELKESCHQNSVVLLIANKFDLIERRQIPRDECDSFADQHGLDWIETSAITGFNVKESFLRVAHEIFMREQNGSLILSEESGRSTILTSAGQKKCGC